MDLLGSLTGSGGGQHQGLAQAIIEHITQTGGVQNVLNRFHGAGLGGKVNSWVGTGQNESVSGEEVERGLGKDSVNQIAQKAGMPSGMASGAIASILPSIIDKFTPNGQVPDHSSFMSMAQGLLSNFKKSA